MHNDKMKEKDYPKNLIEDLKEYLPENCLIDANNPDVERGIAAAMAMLTEQEQMALIMRYRQQCTLDEIGKHFELTKERARQIVVKSLRKLTVAPGRNWMQQGLEGYINNEVQRKSRLLANSHLKEQYLKGYEAGYAVAKGEPQPKEETNLLLIIEEMGFSIRTLNCLKRAGYSTLQDLLLLSITETKKIRNLGLTCSGEVAHKLSELGFVDTAWAECLQYRKPEDGMLQINADEVTDTDDLE